MSASAAILNGQPLLIAAEESEASVAYPQGPAGGGQAFYARSRLAGSKRIGSY
jgi:hypothetical protein